MAIKAGQMSRGLERILRATRGLLTKEDLAELWHISYLLYQYHKSRKQK